MKSEAQAESLFAYFRDSIFILQSAIHHYRNGEELYYRVAALQLRLLLCDTVHRHNRMEDISLLPNIFPDCKLPPISSKGLPGKGASLPLVEWLNLPLCGLDGVCIPIRDFIRRVCDQDGGAHVDLKPVAGLSAFPNRAEIIIQIAELVCLTTGTLPSNSGFS